MARYSTDHKEKTRAAIVDAAAERIRSGGFDALGVASIMAEAGLTHGGFYAHFPSRDALLAAAVTRLFDKACETVGRFEETYGEAGLDTLAERLGRLIPPTKERAGGKKAALALYGDMVGALSVSRTIGDAKQSGELLAGKRKAISV